VQLVLKRAALRFRFDEVFYLLDLVRRAGLEALRVMEDELRVVLENELVLDIMFAALNKQCSTCQAQLENAPRRCLLAQLAMGAEYTNFELGALLTSFPPALNISGSSSAFAPQTFLKIVVFPAFARPIIRTRKCSHFARRSRTLKKISFIETGKMSVPAHAGWEMVG
jgi:hypothetical protein